MKRRGISPVIATVMIMLITIAAAALLMGFVLPFITDQTEGASECFDVFQGVEFGSTSYNCYLNTSINCETNPDVPCNDRTGFSVRLKKEGIVGFKVSLTGAGDSDVYDIYDEIENVNLRMLNYGFGDPLNFATVGGMRTYVVDKDYESIKVTAILETGKTCDVMDTVILGACMGEAVALVNP